MYLMASLCQVFGKGMFYFLSYEILASVLAARGASCPAPNEICQIKHELEYQTKCLCVCQACDLFLKTQMPCNDIFYYLWTLPSVNVIEATGNGNCQGNLTKNPHKTYYGSGSKNQFRRHILQPWVLFGKTYWCLTFSETNQKSHLEVPVLNYKQRPDQIHLYLAHSAWQNA